MVKVVLFEDEPSAMRRLIRLINELRPGWEITGKADSVKAGLQLLKEVEYDLILSDIQLSDGTCFEILHHFNTSKPVIFITAFDEFVLKAFDFNSIHYLVKPIVRERLNAAFSKFESQSIHSSASVDVLIQGKPEGFSGRLLSKVGNVTRIINVPDIAIIHHQDRATKVYTLDEKSHLVDHSVDHLEKYLSHISFYRINRNSIINRDAVISWQSESSNRVGLVTKPKVDFDLIVSKDKTPDFKTWLSG